MMFDQIPEWFKQTKEGKQAVAEERAKTLSAREELVHSVEVGNAKLTAGLPALDKTLETARAAEAKAAAALSEATGAVRAAYAARRSFVWQCEREINRAQSELHRTADPAIGDTLKEFERAIERARNSSSLTYAGDHENPFSGKMVRGESNVEAIVAEVDRLAAIAVDVGALLQSAEGDVQVRLAALRKAAGLPKLASAAA